MKVGILEPHLLQFGGIRRMVELSNRLVGLGHDVTLYLPDDQRMSCDWLPCKPRIRPISAGLHEPIDVLVFNEESQWFVPWMFTDVGRRVFYALHAAWHYGKPGAWEAVRAPVDYQLANSAWTAGELEAETGHRPEVLLGGVNRDTFRPTTVMPVYPLICVGDPRPWKGTDTIRRAADILGLPLELIFPKRLPQHALAEEIGRAEVFVVGSEVEGFGQPGLEALACGVPLVTTDNGGCREYAVHEQTALVVPPNDAEAMAEAIARMRQDRELRDLVRANGLAMAERFDWDASGRKFGQILEDVAERRLPQPRGLVPNRRDVGDEPELAIVVLQWDQLHHTLACVDSIRRNTDVPYELILVDNGSNELGEAYVKAAADVPILNGRNVGFASGMNQGLDAARAPFVVFANNDTVFPPGWSQRLIETFRSRPTCGIVVPAVTTAGNPRTVRDAPGEEVVTLAPFEAPPSGVVYVMSREVAQRLNGWDENYPVASAEDIDLCFQIWVNGLDIVFDETVLIQHVGKGTAAVKLDDYEEQWAANRGIFFEKWLSANPQVVNLGTCGPEEFARNLAVARSVVGWMQRYFALRDRTRGLRRRTAPMVVVRALQPVARAALRSEVRIRTTRAGGAVRRYAEARPALRRLWDRLKSYARRNM